MKKSELKQIIKESIQGLNYIDIKPFSMTEADANEKWILYTGSEFKKKKLGEYPNKRAAVIAYNKLVKTDNYDMIAISTEKAFNESKINEESKIDFKSIRKEFPPIKGTDIRDQNGAVLVFFYGKNPNAVKWVEKIKSKYPNGIVYTDTSKMGKSMNEEAKVNSAKEFTDYANTVLKKAHGDKFDQSKADKMIKDIITKNKNDWGAMIGILNNSLAEGKKRNELKKLIKEIILSEKSDPLMDLATDVYDIVDYKDLGNKNKIKSALKKLGKSTDPLTVGQVMRKIKAEIGERKINTIKDLIKEVLTEGKTVWYINKWDEDGDEETVKKYTTFDKGVITKDFDSIASKLKEDEELHLMKDDDKYVGEYLFSVVNRKGKLNIEITKGSRTLYKPYNINKL